MPWQLVRLRLVWIDAEAAMETTETVHAFLSRRIWKTSAGRYEHNLPNETEKEFVPTT